MGPGRGAQNLSSTKPRACRWCCVGRTLAAVPKDHVPVGFQDTDPSCRLPCRRKRGCPAAGNASACLGPSF